MRIATHRQADYFRQTALEVYLLPTTPWDEVFALQQRLVYEISGEPRQRAALILCEHYPIITVGGQGSRRHVRIDEHELHCQRIELRWTNRGSGCWLQLPGQLAAYPILPLGADTFGLEAYRNRLYQTLLHVLDEFDIAAERDRVHTGIRVADREIASVGIAVKNWVAYHGCRLNVCVPLDRFEWVQSNPLIDRKMTCMFRERRLPVRTDAVRESFLRHFVCDFGMAAFFLCNPPPVAPAKRRVNVAT